MGVHHSVEAEACQSGLQLAAVALALAAASVAAVAIAALLAWALRSSCRPFRRRTGSRARELRIGRQGGGGARGREREQRFGFGGRTGAREKSGAPVVVLLVLLPALGGGVAEWGGLKLWFVLGRFWLLVGAGLVYFLLFIYKTPQDFVVLVLGVFCARFPPREARTYKTKVMGCNRYAEKPEDIESAGRFEQRHCFAVALFSRSDS